MYLIQVRFEGVEGDNLEVEQGSESEFTFDGKLSYNAFHILSY